MRFRTRLSVPALAALLGLPIVVTAERIETRTELDAILSGSEEYLEDFEHVSFHSGGQMPLPNPFNAVTGAPLWADLIPFATYSSTGSLTMLAWFLHGDDSNILLGTGDITITFDDAQLAVGFDLDGAGDTLHQIVTFSNGPTVIDTWAFDLAPATTLFVGWQNPVGITSVQIETTVAGSPATTEVDNVAWGVAICVWDCDGSGDAIVGVEDFLALLAQWGQAGTSCHVADGATVGVADFLELLAHWGECP